MSKKNLFCALVMTLGLNLGTANAYHCTCWDDTRSSAHCYGRVDPFGGDLVACRNACKHYVLESKKTTGGEKTWRPHPPHGGGPYAYPYIDSISLQKCKDQYPPPDKTLPILGAW